MTIVKQRTDLTALECGDPIEPVDVSDFVDGLLRNHSSIAGDYESLDAEVVFELPHLGDECLRVVGIALVDGDCDGAAAFRRE